MGVDLGGREVSVPEQFLNDAQVGAVIEQVGGEGVAEGVGGDLMRGGDGRAVLVEEAAQAPVGPLGA